MWRVFNTLIFTLMYEPQPHPQSHLLIYSTKPPSTPYVWTDLGKTPTPLGCLFTYVDELAKIQEIKRMKFETSHQNNLKYCICHYACSKNRVYHYSVGAVPNASKHAIKRACDATHIHVCTCIVRAEMCFQLTWPTYQWSKHVQFRKRLDSSLRLQL